MTDVFFEQIIAKKNTFSVKLKKVAIVIGFLAVLGLLFMLGLVEGMVGETVRSIGIIVAVAAAYGSYFLITGLNVEYEYILTNGEFDVDKITARRKRKRLISFDCKNVSEFGAYTPGQKFNGVTEIQACVSLDEPHTYYLVVDTMRYGKCAVVFNPNEKILKNLQTYIKRTAIK